MQQKPLHEVRNGSLIVNLHPGQIRTYDSDRRFVFMLAGAQGGKCGRFNVLLANGKRVFVSEVCPGDVVLCLDDNNKICKSTVTAMLPSGKQDVYRVTTVRGREIEVTGNHPLLSDAGWKECNLFKKGDWIATPRTLPTAATKRYDKNMLRIIGYLLGDGGLTKSVKFSNINKEILDDLSNCLPYPCVLKHTGGCDYSIVGYGRGTSNNNPVLDEVRKHGIDVLAKHKKIPEFVFELINSDIAQMLNTLFACDGWVDDKGIGFASASEQLIKDIYHLLLRFGINPIKRYKQVKLNDKLFDSWVLSITDTTDLKTFATEIGITSKQKKLLNLIDRKSNHRNNGEDIIPNYPIDECKSMLFEDGPIHGRWNKPKDVIGYDLVRSARHKNISRSKAQELCKYFEVGNDCAYSDIYWDKIKSIEYIKNADVYDIEIEGHHNFIADDIFAHNTEFGPIWMYREMQMRGPGDYLVVSPSYPLQQKKVVPAYIAFFKTLLGIAEYYKADRIMKVVDKDDSEYTIFFGSADRPDSLESATAKAAHLDEVGQDSFRLSSWEAVLRRLSIHQGRVLGTTTLYNLGWLKNEVYERWEQGDLDYDVIQFDSIENPAFPLDEYKRAKATLPSWKFDLFYRGRYARPAGMIYNSFDENVHKIKPFQIPVEWPRHVGIDPGGVNTATVWIAEDTTRKAFYVYRSTLTGGKSTKEHCAIAKEYAETERVVSWCGGARSEGQFRKDWTAEGVPVKESPIIDVESGIDRVISLFKQQRLFVIDNESNRGLLDEIGSYSRVLNDRQEPTEKIKDKETFHMLDALRYIISYVTNEKPVRRPPTTTISFGGSIPGSRV